MRSLIFCEKPIDLDLGRVDHARQAADRAGVPVLVGFNRRFDPGLGAIGKAVLNAEGWTPALRAVSAMVSMANSLGLSRIWAARGWKG